MRPILLVEDDPNDALLVRDTLEQVHLINDIDVTTTVDAAKDDVSARCRRSSFQTSICPDSLASTFSTGCATAGPLGSVPVIMMSVSTDEVHHMRASALRALIFMTKPIKREVLLDQLRGLGLLITHIPQGEQAGLIIGTAPTKLLLETPKNLVQNRTFPAILN